MGHRPGAFFHQTVVRPVSKGDRGAVLERDGVLCEAGKGDELCPGGRRGERNSSDYEEQSVDRGMEDQIPGISGGALQKEAVAETVGGVPGIGLDDEQELPYVKEEYEDPGASRIPWDGARGEARKRTIILLRKKGHKSMATPESITTEAPLESSKSRNPINPKPELIKNAILLYPSIQNQTISHGRAAEILGIRKSELIDIYDKLGYSYLDSTIDTLDSELKNFRQLKHGNPRDR